jgi:site-specific recombinase XerD
MDLYRRSATFQLEPRQSGTAQCALSAHARGYVRDSRAANTARAYTSDLKGFSRWCHQFGVSPLPAPPALLANYVAALANHGRKVATIERAVSAISQAHVKAGFPSPRFDQTFRQVMTGIRRRLGVRPTKKRPVLVADLRALIAATADGIKGQRDRALLALGFAGAFRRAELVGLDIGDLAFTVDGLIVTLRKSKADQHGVGVEIGIPYGERPASCPVRLVRRWLETLNSEEGALFRSVNRHGGISSRRLSGRTVATLIQTLAPRAGLQPASVGAHSLRSGFVTTAVRAGCAEHLVMRHTRHKNVVVFRGYVAASSPFAGNPAAGIGL